MALFKIFKGSADNFKDPNNNKVNTTNSGYAYFTPDDEWFPENSTLLVDTEPYFPVELNAHISFI